MFIKYHIKLNINIYLFAFLSVVRYSNLIVI